MALSERPVVLVTGARRGIGRGIALHLGRDGFAVIINSVTPDDPHSGEGAYEVKRAIEAGGGEAEVFRADVANADERRAMVDFAVERFGRIDLLVNNAGVAPRQRRDLLEATEESFDWVMNINLKGAYFLTQLVANKMIAWKQSGVVAQPRIVFISSISACAVSVARGEYCVSKAGLFMAMQLYATRLAEYDIPVIAVSPGIIESDMTAPVKAKYDRLILEQDLLPVHRWGTPEDVAKVVSAFARGDLDYSTGQQIEVGGGFGIRRL
ncbi:MAG TPA: 3-ketoacyl-ACP reductase [Candidatus Hydrogenedentes bacterium]|nr:3-ketoacyl-ACP reductase [Candidatus Hydrogenedentota bacterium]HPG69304.1 3-ketoacyl-ACP reductase [Candidatus Hydrogenedentota bacterium]